MQGRRGEVVSKRVNISAIAALLLAALVGCGGMATPPPPPGQVSVQLVPDALTVPKLMLTAERLTLENITLFGDVSTANLTINEVSLDLLGIPAPLVFPSVPQGLYSRVRFQASEVDITGTYGGVPLRIQFENDATVVDLRSPTGQEVAPNHNGQFALTVDDNSWYANGLLDGATVSNGQILVSNTSNASIAQTLAMRIAASFAL
jgi:hypothetical protein